MHGSANMPIHMSTHMSMHMPINASLHAAHIVALEVVVHHVMRMQARHAGGDPSGDHELCLDDTHDLCL